MMVALLYDFDNIYVYTFHKCLVELNQINIAVNNYSAIAASTDRTHFKWNIKKSLVCFEQAGMCC